jgi:hypothetical protein
MYFFEGKCKKRYNHLNQSTPKDHLNPFYQKKEAISFETAPSSKLSKNVTIASQSFW